MLEITSTRHNPLIDPHPGGVELGDPAVPVLRRHRRRHDGAGRPGHAARGPGRGHAQLLFHADAAAGLRAHEHRHAGAAAGPDAPAVRVAHLPHLPGHLADGLGLVGADRRLRRAAGLGADPPARRLALAGSHGAGPQDLVRRHRRQAAVDRARWAGPTWCWASAWASTPASCSTPWWRGRCGTAPSSGPCSWSRACRPASR